MNLGTEKLIETIMGMIVKSLNLDPEMVKKHISQIGENVALFSANQKRIETKLDILLKERGLEYVEPQIERASENQSDT